MLAGAYLGNSYLADLGPLTLKEQTFSMGGTIVVRTQIEFTMSAALSNKILFTLGGGVQAQTDYTFMLDAIIASGQFRKIGGSQSYGIYRSNEAPKPLHRRVPKIYDPDDVPELVRPVIQDLDPFNN